MHSHPIEVREILGYSFFITFCGHWLTKDFFFFYYKSNNYKTVKIVKILWIEVEHVNKVNLYSTFAKNH